ncbi:MAG: hypothetical protein ACI9FJ_001899, partial [Alteromonadaceae bacterium]
MGLLNPYNLNQNHRLKTAIVTEDNIDASLKEKILVSEEEYLEGELVREIKHHLIDGQVYAMAGASANHD